MTDRAILRSQNDQTNETVWIEALIQLSPFFFSFFLSNITYTHLRFVLTMRSQTREKVRPMADSVFLLMKRKRSSLVSKFALLRFLLLPQLNADGWVFLEGARVC